jgi:hypothetical protein
MEQIQRFTNMNKKNNIWRLNIGRNEGYFLLVLLLLFLLSVSFAASVPTAPVPPTYISNTTYTSGTVNRSNDTKGTITTITLSATQQDYKWKAYVGNVSGKLALANAAGTAIYDWNMGSPRGEVYISRFSNINWNTINCSNQSTINTEQTGIGMSSSAMDNINATFNHTNHISFDVGTTPMNGCRSTATYVSGAPQTMSSAFFQEILLQDYGTGNLVYATIINASTSGYNNQNYDFQIIVGENESATIPITYYFWVEIGG